MTGTTLISATLQSGWSVRTVLAAIIMTGMAGPLCIPPVISSDDLHHLLLPKESTNHKLSKINHTAAVTAITNPSNFTNCKWRLCASFKKNNSRCLSTRCPIKNNNGSVLVNPFQSITHITTRHQLSKESNNSLLHRWCESKTSLLKR
jgi:hypothetical protein